MERDILSADSTIERLLAAHEAWNLEGVTLLGGEPFLQAQGLADVAEAVSRAGLSVMTFTGYTLQELNDLSLPGTSRLLAWTDVLVDGPYVASKPDRSRNWVGSTNQKFHYLTDRYNATIEEPDAPKREVEWRIRDDGRLIINGWPCTVK